MEWCHFQWPWLTPNISFKVTVLVKGKYIKTVHSLCVVQLQQIIHLQGPFDNYRADLSGLGGMACGALLDSRDLPRSKRTQLIDKEETTS